MLSLNCKILKIKNYSVSSPKLLKKIKKKEKGLRM